MLIEDELSKFDAELAVLRGFSKILASVDLPDATDEDFFLAEAIIFRLYRIYERLIRISFLFYCTVDKTIAGNEVKSKLRCDDIDTAEAIIKAGNKFLDWGNPASTKKLADLVFDNGYPISELLSPVHSSLVDLQRFRNYVAHDSDEAASGFRSSRSQYVRLGDISPETVGQLSLYRKGARADNTLSFLIEKISALSTILRSL